MNSRINRRSFLKRAAVTSGALSAAHLFPGPGILRAAGSGNKVNCAVIGCGDRGMTHIGAVAGENLVAIVDPSEPRHAAALKALAKRNPTRETCRRSPTIARCSIRSANRSTRCSLPRPTITTPRHR